MSRIPDKVRSDNFDVGQRVVVTKIREDAPDPDDAWHTFVGYYGHVRRITPGRRLVVVVLEGCIDGPVSEHAENALGWPFWPEELEHAD